MEQVEMEKGDTWPKVLHYNYTRYGDNHRAMRHKHYGIWQTYTWKDYYLGVKYLALGLRFLGFEPGDKLLIMGDNAPQWYHAELAAQANHGISVGMYSDLTPTEIQYIAGNAGAGFAVVEDQEQVDKFLEILDALPLLKRVIYWKSKGLAHYDDPVLLGYERALEFGEKYEEEHPGIFEKSIQSGKADDACALVYTSGVSGAVPRGVLHTFRSMRAGAEYHMRRDPWSESDNVVPHLPPAWMTEQWLGIGCHLLSACILNFAESPETQLRDARETGPSIVFYGARLWERQAAMIHARMLASDALKRLAFRLLMPVGYRAADAKFKGRRTGFFQKAAYALSERILFRPFRKSLGLSNARICYTTGSILSPETFRFCHAVNIPLKTIYFTTEGGPLAAAGDETMHLEPVDAAHEDAEVRISGSGEIVYRQAGLFSGYLEDPGRTKEVCSDGWFQSGDYGSLREDGRVVIVERMADLIELAGGVRLAPQLIESRLRFSPYIMDAWVLAGPESAYASAVIVINFDTVSRWAGQQRVAYATFAELSQREEVYGLVEQDIGRVNETLPHGAGVRKYVNLPRPFDPDEGELTRTRKLRRMFLQEHYRDLVEAIYRDRTEVPLEALASYGDGRRVPKKTAIRIKTVEGA